jgi:uncharacterized protein
MAMMLALGIYRFALNTATYQSFKRNNEYRWPAVERIGKEPLLQSIGAGAERIDLEGIIYPHFRGGLEQINIMRNFLAQRKPHLLIDGKGYILGYFVITHIEETQTTFLADGTPKKVEFRISLARYGE